MQKALDNIAIQIHVCPHRGELCSPFEVAPTRNTIDSLKKAVQAERAKAGVVIDLLTMKVYARIAEGVWAEVAEDAPLIENVKASAYHVVLQKP